jgi:hypothetical protein
MNARRNCSVRSDLKRVLAQRSAATKRAVALRVEDAEKFLCPLLVALVTQLPVSVLARILLFLPLRERARYACVHKQLYEATLRPVPETTASGRSAPTGPNKVSAKKTVGRLTGCVISAGAGG